MTLAGIETATFRFVVQHVNHCATAENFVGYFIIRSIFIGFDILPPPPW